MSYYKPYPTYKNSGVKWIIQVPEHWEFKPLKISVTHNDDVIPDFTHPEELIKYVDISSVSYNEGISKAEEMVFGNAPSRARRKAKVGDVIVSTVRTYLKAVASVDEEFADCTFSTGFAVLRSRPKKIEPRFLKWLVLNDLFIQAVEAHSEGLSYPAINPPTLVALKTALPSIDEQKIIASVLDTETSHINSLIAKKSRFIELLKEKRQSLIIESVTKGQNPNVSFIDSGIEWIGTIPKHWEIKPFFALLSELNRKNIGLIESNILSLSYGRVVKKPDNRNMGLVPESYETYQIVEPGDVVFRFTDLQNDKRSLRSAEVTERGIITSAYMAVRPHSIQSNYFAWLMRSYDLCKVFYGLGGGIRQSLKFEDVKRLPIVVPPIEEQINISKFIGRQLNLIDTLIEKTQRSIDLLKERRIAFITAAVTGKIDLRNKQETIS